MEKNKYRLKGHESFIIRDGWITNGLYAVHDNPKVFSSTAAADTLGVGTNMAKSIRYWLKTAGLMKENSMQGAHLTDIGELIFQNDPYMEDIFTTWLIHINVAVNYEQATTWNVYFNNLDMYRFQRDELLPAIMPLMLDATKMDKLPERSIKDDCTAILSMYSSAEKSDDPEEKRESPFADLGLLSRKGNYFERTRPDLSTIDPLLIMYFIAGCFEEDQTQGKKSVSIDDLDEKPNMPGRILQLNRIMVNDYLDALHNKGLIVVNRTAGLDMVYEQEKLTRKDVVEAYYQGVTDDSVGTRQNRSQV